MRKGLGPKRLGGSNKTTPCGFTITPAKKIKRTKISPACKAAAKRKFDVWPSAYASGWGVRCTRNPSKYLKR
jgi:hypothetical protein